MVGAKKCRKSVAGCLPPHQYPSASSAVKDAEVLSANGSESFAGCPRHPASTSALCSTTQARQLPPAAPVVPPAAAAAPAASGPHAA